MGNHIFVIFAVLDVSLTVNLCINCSFFYIYLYINCGRYVHAPVCRGKAARGEAAYNLVSVKLETQSSHKLA